MSVLDDAIRRLEAAVDHVEIAVEQRLDLERQVSGLESEMHRLVTDRSRLAQSLDSAEARSARMEDANRDVARRLVTAMETIRDVLQRNGAG